MGDQRQSFDGGGETEIEREREDLENGCRTFEKWRLNQRNVYRRRRCDIQVSTRHCKTLSPNITYSESARGEQTELLIYIYFVHSENGLAFQTIYSTTTIRKNKETQLVIYAQMYACISLPFISPLVFFRSHMFLIGPRGGGKKKN